MTFYVITLLSFAFAFAVSQTSLMHFFQLNSYSTVEQMHRFGENPGKWIIYPVLTVAMLAGFLFEPIKYLIPLAFILGIWLARPKKAKKPLVFTKRVKRMLLTEIIMAAIAIGVPDGLAGMRAASFAMIMVFLLSPFWAIVANFINKPVEKAVNQHFINDAKRILKACPDLKIIGITGSYGKTSMKFYLTTLLKGKYNVLMTPESYNTPMGVVITVRQKLKSTHEIFVCEMGAKKVGEIKEICDIVHPHHGIITSIGPQHLETFKSLENIKSTKFELSDALPSDGMLFLNGDDENVVGYNKRDGAITYGMKNGDYKAYDISISEKGTSFSVKAPNGDSGSFTTKLIGEHNVLNITGAIAAAHMLGVSMTELKPQVRKLECVPHRLQLIDKGDALIIDDAYNSNPSGTKAALNTLSLITGFKILVTPGMVELGEKQDECNFEFGVNAADVCDFVVLVGKSQTESIKNGLDSAGCKSYAVAETIDEALEVAYKADTKGQKRVILLENDLPDNY